MEEYSAFLPISLPWLFLSPLGCASSRSASLAVYPAVLRHARTLRAQKNVSCVTVFAGHSPPRRPQETTCHAHATNEMQYEKVDRELGLAYFLLVLMCPT